MKNPDNFNFLTVNENINDIKWEDTIKFVQRYEYFYILFIINLHIRPKSRQKKFILSKN